MFVNEVAWAHLTPEKAADAVTHLAGLPSAERDDDEQAKRFDLLALRLQLSLLEPDPGAERVRRLVQQIASGLLDQTAIPVIKAQQQLLDEVAGDQWWEDVTVPMLELMRRRLRGLVKLLDKVKQVMVYTDMVDELGELKEIELHRVAVGVDADRFRAKAREYMRAHLDHVALQKVRRNRQLTSDDLSALEQMLVDAGVGGSSGPGAGQRAGQGLRAIRTLIGGTRGRRRSGGVLTVPR